MASINFNNLKPTSKNIQDYTYVDLSIDLHEEPIGISGNWRTTPGAGRDIAVAYDLNAIKNSIQNLFNTVPGERFLLPDYGSDLRRYVFEPITEFQGKLVGREIYSSITKWEPRVRVNNIDIVGRPDRNEYEVTLILQVPFLKKKLGFESLLTREGYFFTT